MATEVRHRDAERLSCLCPSQRDATDRREGLSQGPESPVSWRNRSPSQRFIQISKSSKWRFARAAKPSRGAAPTWVRRGYGCGYGLTLDDPC